MDWLSRFTCVFIYDGLVAESSHVCSFIMDCLRRFTCVFIYNGLVEEVHVCVHL